MKIMNTERLGRKAMTLCLVMMLVTTCSMVTLATSSAPVGELIVTGRSTDGKSVTVNGEPAKSGRTVFSSSTITTPDTTGAVISFGKAGKIELAPNTTFILNATETTVSGSLSAGSITVLNSAQSVGVTTLSGDVVTLNTGETATATSGTASKKAKPGPGGLDWAYWGLIIGGAAAVIIIVAATTGDNAVVSPVR